MTDQVAGPPANVSVMGELVQENGALIWSDQGVTNDVLSYALDLSNFAATEIAVEVDYYGYSMEDSGVWFYAESASGATNLACNEENVTSNTAYSPEELAMIPYVCSPTVSGDVTIGGVFAVDVGESIDRFVLRSLMRDNNRGDYSQLNRLVVYVR
jgi:hypothetical protein